MPGQLFGPYRIERLLGQGGMGKVYLAEECDTGRRVALKVLRSGKLTQSDRKRFLREGQLAASINHPHTVYVRGADPRGLARRFLAEDDVLSLRFEPGAVIVETAKPDDFYARLTTLAASGEAGVIDEVTSPDDNLQAVFAYLVK